MDIVIPTAGRWLDQPTLAQLRVANIPAILIVKPHEATKYAERWGVITPVISLPVDMDIAPTRQWIMDNIGRSDKIVMLDDDLTFYQRRVDEPDKLEDIPPPMLKEAFRQLEIALDVYSHVGFAAREGANRNTQEVIENTRIMRVLGYRRDHVKEIGARFDTMQVMEDFHVALNLLEEGYPNAILNFFAHNQAGSGKAGGCSVFRTRSVQSAAAEALARLHPGFVRVTQKETKGSFGGGVRDDVVVQWKRAYAHGEIVRNAKRLAKGNNNGR